MRPGVNFGVPVGWGFVFFVTSHSKCERVVTSWFGTTLGLSGGLRCFILPSGTLCDVTVIALACSDFERTVEAKNKHGITMGIIGAEGTMEVGVIRARGTGKGKGHTVWYQLSHHMYGKPYLTLKQSYSTLRTVHSPGQIKHVHVTVILC